MLNNKVGLQHLSQYPNYPMCNNISQDFKICGQFDLDGKKSFALDEVISYCSTVVDVAC